MITRPDYILEDYHRIRIANDMGELLSMQWENANAILYPRSQDPEFQNLLPHFGEITKLIEDNRYHGNRLQTITQLNTYRKKASNKQQKLCFDYIIADVRSLKYQCAQYWELRAINNQACQFHIDGGINKNTYPHTIITTCFGKGTRWKCDEDVDFEARTHKANTPIHRFQAGDICKFNNEGERPFYHAASKGLRMTLLVR